MPHLPFHQEQLNFIISLAGSRIEFLNPFFRLLNYFDTHYFYMALVVVIWLGVSYQWGLRIFYWMSLNSLAVQMGKIMIGWPRPSTDFPSIGMFHPKSNGFPSGAATIAVFLGSLLIYYRKSPAGWFWGLFYIALLSFSRLYLGVHYPIDILGGWILGIITFLLFIWTKEPIDQALKKLGQEKASAVAIAVPLALLLFSTSKPNFPIGGLLGVGIGSYFSLKYTHSS